MFSILAYGFMQRSFLAGTFIALSCALLGVFIVLKKNSFISEGLAHISFGGLALGLFIGINPLVASLGLTIMGAVLLVFMQEKTKLKGDALIGILSYTGFAFGILLVSLSRGFNADIFSYLFGNILTVSEFDILFSGILSFFIISFILLFYNEFSFLIFDEEGAKTSGINVRLFNYIIGILIGITVVISIRIIGIILVAAFMILPASSSLNISKSFKQTMIFSVIISLFSLILGLVLSFVFDLAAGATIVILSFLVFIITLLLSKR